MVSPQVFALNIYFLIGLLLLLAISTVLVVAFWTSIKIWMWNIRRRKAEDAERRRHFRTRRPAVPADRPRRLRGAVPEPWTWVYHLPSGQRLCPDCYRRTAARARRFARRNACPRFPALTRSSTRPRRTVS